MIIISIDPGYERIGIAVLEKREKTKEVLLFSECFKTSSKIPHVERLGLIGNEVSRIIGEFKPTALAIEKLFFNTNQKTAILVAESRGVVLYQASIAQIPVFEYVPGEIKIAVTGYGKSEKNQVAMMVEKLIKIEKEIKSDDEYDAIAVGLTCLAREKFNK